MRAPKRTLPLQKRVRILWTRWRRMGREEGDAKVERETVIKERGGGREVPFALALLLGGGVLGRESLLRLLLLLLLLLLVLLLVLVVVLRVLVLVVVVVLVRLLLTAAPLHTLVYGGIQSETNERDSKEEKRGEGEGRRGGGERLDGKGGEMFEQVEEGGEKRGQEEGRREKREGRREGRREGGRKGRM